MIYKFYRLCINVLDCGLKLKSIVVKKPIFKYNIISKFNLVYYIRQKCKLKYNISQRPTLNLSLLHETNLSYVPYITLDNKRYVTLDDKIYYVKRLIYE